MPDAQARATKSAPLFRHEAIRSAAGSPFGQALHVHWRGTRIFAACAFGLLLVLLSFVATVEYAPIHRVLSYTDVRAGLVRLGAPISGQVKQIAVTDGASVRKGDLLAVLSSDRLNAAGASQHATLRRELEAEQGMLAREIEAARAEAAANRAITERRLEGLEAERQAVLADLEAGTQLLKSLEAQHDRMTSIVAQGYATQDQLFQKRNELQLQQSRLAATRAALARIERDIATARAERRLVDARRDGVVESRRRARGELERLAVQGDLEAEQSLRAPIDGFVSTAVVAPGQSIATGQLLFTLAPLDEPLILRLLVPARAAGSVRVGMQIKVVFAAYPREKFGEFPVRVLSVSNVPLLPADIQPHLPMNEPAFIAIAALPPRLLAPNGQAIRIKPGMRAEALVPIERRTALQWLLAPLLRGFNEGGAVQ